MQVGVPRVHLLPAFTSLSFSRSIVKAPVGNAWISRPLFTASSYHATSVDGAAPSSAAAAPASDAAKSFACFFPLTALPFLFWDAVAAALASVPSPSSKTQPHPLPRVPGHCIKVVFYLAESWGGGKHEACSKWYARTVPTVL